MGPTQSPATCLHNFQEHEVVRKSSRTAVPRKGSLNPQWLHEWVVKGPSFHASCAVPCSNRPIKVLHSMLLGGNSTFPKMIDLTDIILNIETPKFNPWSVRQKQSCLATTFTFAPKDSKSSLLRFSRRLFNKVRGVVAFSVPNSSRAQGQQRQLQRSKTDKTCILNRPGLAQPHDVIEVNIHKQQITCTICFWIQRQTSPYHRPNLQACRFEQMTDRTDGSLISGGPAHMNSTGQQTCRWLQGSTPNDLHRLQRKAGDSSLRHLWESLLLGLHATFFCFQDHEGNQKSPQWNLRCLPTATATGSQHLNLLCWPWFQVNWTNMVLSRKNRLLQNTIRIYQRNIFKWATEKTHLIPVEWLTDRDSCTGLLYFLLVWQRVI